MIGLNLCGKLVFLLVFLNEIVKNVASGCCASQEDNKLVSLCRIRGDFSPMLLRREANLKSLAVVT